MTKSGRATQSVGAAIGRRNWLAGTVAGTVSTGFTSTGCRSYQATTRPAGVPPSATHPTNHNVLSTLLERNHALRPDYGGGFSNHLSMALYSLSALGANEEQLVRFADTQWKRLEPLPAESERGIDATSWKTHLGQRSAFNGFRVLFAQAIARNGRDATLREYLPDLLPGIGCAAFHALIRTGYGVRFADDREIADGLAYWAMGFVRLGPLGPAGEERDPRALLENVRATRALVGRDLPGHLITGKMRSAAQIPEFQPIQNALSPDETTLASLAAAAVRLYADTGDFVALHTVTGAHAFRMLQPFISPADLGLRYFWQASLAAYVTFGAPPVVDPPASSTPPWTDSLVEARFRLDEHDIKLVDIAHEEGTFYDDPIYRRAAARRLKLSKTG